MKTSRIEHYVADIIPTLKWRGGKLSVRLAFAPRDIAKLFIDYREAYYAARTTENSKTNGDSTFKLFPKDLCDFLDRKLTAYFSIKAYILDPNQAESDSVQPTVFEMECPTENPLKGIIRVDMINAQRGFSDPDAPNEGEKFGNNSPHKCETIMISI